MGNNRFSQLEQCFASFKEGNNTSSEQAQPSRLPTINRRHILAGLLGGGALLGTASQPAAAATMWEDSDNDGLLETPNYDGIDVTTVQADEAAIKRSNQIRVASEFTGANGGEMIQAAIDDLPPEGGTVIVPANGPDTNGRWEFSEAVRLRSRLRLKGSSFPQLYLLDNSDSDIFKTNETEGDSTVEHVVVEGLRMDGNKAANGRYTQSDGVGRNTAGVWCLESHDVTVRDCVFESFRGYGVSFSLSTHGKCVRCEAFDMQDDGFTATDSPYNAAATEDIIFRDCYAHGNTNNAGFEIDDGPTDVELVDCVARNNKFGMRTHTHSDASAPSDITFRSCEIHDSSELGLFFGTNPAGNPRNYRCEDVTITGSGTTALAASYYGANANDQPIEGLHVEGFRIDHPSTASGPAVDLRHDNGLSNVRLTKGHITMHSSGFAVQASQSPLTNALFADIHIDGNGAAESGLNLLSASVKRNITVRDCTIHDCLERGIDLRGYGGGVENVTVKGGNIYNNGRDTSKDDPLRAGILISAPTTNPEHVRIEGVRCYDDQGTATQTYGIYRSGVVNSHIVDNQLFGNSLGAFGGTADASSIERDNIMQ